LSGLPITDTPPNPARERARRIFILLATIVFLAYTIKRFHWLGGPYFEIPRTIQDHVWPARFPSADAILLCREAEPLLARNAEVTVVAPAQAPNYDQTHWLTGLGLLPRQHVVAPDLEGNTRDELTDYVIAIGDPLPHPAYQLVKQFPEGALYEVKP
jgi:hypothetical protein